MQLEVYRQKFSKLIYHNPLQSLDDTAGFIMEGDGLVSFPNHRMRMENLSDPEEGQKSNFVFWCPQDFPADFMAEWNFWPIREPGLCIFFFCASGINGKDIFDSSLAKRTGEYRMYHHGDINAFHISYFRRRWPQERAFHLCNLRKSYGFHMVAQGADPLPSVEDAEGPYQICVVKDGPKVCFYINELPIFSWEDDGQTHGPLLGSGKIGFRQMAPLIAEYSDLKIYGVK
ncbi:MAG: DUF1961 family protein [Candidatus Wallacebacter cryptica]|jgi:hypothetical protein